MEFICLYIITFAAIMYITKLIWSYIIEVRRFECVKNSIDDMICNGVAELIKQIEQEERGKKNVKSNSKKKR